MNIHKTYLPQEINFRKQVSSPSKLESHAGD